ncbi:hypothetical protein METHPM2_780008 [Pseudomonas sp. PM2]
MLTSTQRKLLVDGGWRACAREEAISNDGRVLALFQRPIQRDGTRRAPNTHGWRVTAEMN